MVGRDTFLKRHFYYIFTPQLTYGEDPFFLRFLDQMHEIFIMDVHKNQQIYLEDPDPKVPKPKSEKSRKPTKLKAQTDPIRVDKWASQQPAEAWQRRYARDTTKGKLLVDILHKRVWLWDGKEHKALCWHLVIRREVGASKIKYSLSNAHEETSLERFVYMQAQRYWIERSFQDAKTHCGLGDYQAKKWRSWHHHMAMVMMAMLFMLEERLFYKGSYPLLSCSDIVSILCYFLPNRAIMPKKFLGRWRFGIKEGKLQSKQRIEISLEKNWSLRLANVTK